MTGFARQAIGSRLALAFGGPACDAFADGPFRYARPAA